MSPRWKHKRTDGHSGMNAKHNLQVSDLHINHLRNAYVRSAPILTVLYCLLKLAVRKLCSEGIPLASLTSLDQTLYYANSASVSFLKRIPIQALVCALKTINNAPYGRHRKVSQYTRPFTAKDLALSLRLSRPIHSNGESTRRPPFIPTANEGNSGCLIIMGVNFRRQILGLDTPNPILVIGDSLKLIGEYEETIGTCLVFSEGRNKSFSGTFIIDPNQAPAKEVKPIAGLQKILKFRLLHEGDVQDATSEPVDI
ncbi:hypothetical protein AAG906_015916 [Vitis piasezkii]